MQTRLFTTIAALSMTAMVFAGCGDDDDSATDTPTEETEQTETEGELTKADFIEQGDAICAELDVASNLVEPPADETDFARYLSEILPEAELAYEAFAGLQPPADGVEVHEALLVSLEGAIEATEGAQTAAEQGDTVTAEDLLSQAGADGAEADQMAIDYGFVECGA